MGRIGLPAQLPVPFPSRSCVGGEGHGHHVYKGVVPLGAIFLSHHPATH